MVSSLRPRAQTTTLGVIRLLVTICALLGVTATLALAQTSEGPTTGKIIGTVYDSQSREPLIAAQVVIPELGMGNITNDDGYYFINQVPVGRHVIQSDYLGYQSGNQEIEVAAGQTVTADFGLGSDVVQAEAIVALVEYEPFVPEAPPTADLTVETLPVNLPEALPQAHCRPLIVTHSSYIANGEWQFQVSVGGMICGEEEYNCERTYSARYLASYKDTVVPQPGETLGDAERVPESPETGR